MRAAALSLLLLICGMLALPGAARAVGELTYDQCYGDHAGCVSEAGTELASLSGVAVSPDGSAVYVTGSNAVAHFVADPATGELVYDSCLSDISGLCLGDASSAKPLGGAEGLVVDPDHPAVFVAGRTVGDAVQLRTLPSDALLYGGCVSDNGSGSLCGETERTVLGGAKGVAVSPDGDALYVSAFGVKPSFEGAVSHFSVAPEGQITFQGCVSSDGSGGKCGDAGGSKLLRETVGIAVSPNDASLYSASESGVISHYAIDPGSRQFTWTDCVSNDGSAKACEDVPGSGEPLREAEQVAVSPDGRSLYTTSRETVSHFVTGPAGQLKWEGCVSSSSTSQCAQLIGPKELLNVTEGIAVSPDGKSLYVGSASAITSFALGAEGQLAFQGCWTSQATAGCSDLPGEPLGFVDSLAVSPNGASVYAASSVGDLVHLFRALPSTAPGGSTTGPGGATTGAGGPGHRLGRRNQGKPARSACTQGPRREDRGAHRQEALCLSLPGAGRRDGDDRLVSRAGGRARRAQRETQAQAGACRERAHRVHGGRDEDAHDQAQPGRRGAAQAPSSAEAHREGQLHAARQRRDHRAEDVHAQALSAVHARSGATATTSGS